VELKSGFKQTEVGAIPSSWDVARLGDIATIRTGPFGTLLKASEYSDNGGVPLISVGEIRHGFLRVTDQTPRVAEAVTRRLPQYVLRQGDIVVGRKGGVERSALIRLEQNGWFLGSDGLCVRLSADWLHDDFVALLMQSDRIRNWLLQNSIGTTMPSLNQEILGRVTLPVPPVVEQRAIAGALTDIDAYLDALDLFIVKKNDVKQGAMQTLLTGRTRLPGFERPWRTSTVGAEFEIQLGKMLDAARNSGTSKPYIGNRAVQWGRIEIAALAHAPMTPEDLVKYRLRRGDLLVCEGGEIGRAAIWDAPLEECYFQKALHRLRSRQGFRTDLMRFIFEYWSSTGYLANFVTQTSIAHLAKDKLEAVPIQAPLLDEQEAIATVLSDMDAEITALKARRAKVAAIKQGMMQALLTGRLRLPIEEDLAA
jgi:type I restriction enzyme S subunit